MRAIRGSHRRGMALVAGAAVFLSAFTGGGVASADVEDSPSPSSTSATPTTESGGHGTASPESTQAGTPTQTAAPTESVPGGTTAPTDESAPTDPPLSGGRSPQSTADSSPTPDALDTGGGPSATPLTSPADETADGEQQIVPFGIGIGDACGYAGSGIYKDNLCWLDLDGFSSQQGAVGGDRTNCTTVGGVTSCDVANYPVSFTLPGGLQFSAKLNTKGITPAVGDIKLGRFITAVGLPIGSNRLGASGFYSGIPGAPALYQGTDGTLGARPWTEVKLTDVKLTKPDGTSLVEHGLLWADAEATTSNEHIEWTRPAASDKWSVLLNSAGNPMGNACPGVQSSSQSGTTDSTYKCYGGAATGSRSGTPMVYFRAQNSGTYATQAELAGSGKQGVSAALMLAQARVSLKVDGRIDAADQFSVGVASTANGTSLPAVTTTGAQTTAATGYLPIATPVTGTTPVDITATVTGPNAAGYKKSWTCSVTEGGDVVRTYTGNDPTAFAQIKELQVMDCEVKFTPAQLKLQSTNTTLTLSATPDGGATPALTGTSPVGPTAVAAGKFNLASSTTGAWTCKKDGTNVTTTGPSVTLAAGEGWTCDFKATGTYAASCDAGIVYAIGGNTALLWKTDTAAGTTTKVNSAQASRPGVYFNGLGVGAGGSPIYSFQSTSSAWAGAKLYEWNTSTGDWAALMNGANEVKIVNGGGYTASDTQTGTDTNMVAGAVDLKTGKYMFGGFRKAGSTQPPDNKDQFHLWVYDPSYGTANHIKYLGWIDVTSNQGNINGDMAFDAAGNLYVVWGRGDNYAAIFTVKSATIAGALAAPTGGLLPANLSKEFNTTIVVNGAAFDADGKMYLGSGTNARRYTMPQWNYEGQTSLGTAGSVDLASCGSPPTIKVEKYLDGDRVKPTDQFKLELKVGTTVAGDATTTGAASGLQPQVVGPLPVTRGQSLTITETVVGTSPGGYQASYQCTADGEPLTGASGTGKTGTFTYPASGQDVVCRFTNMPLTTQVTMTKLMADENGQNPQPHPGWTLGMTSAAVSGTGTVTPNPTALTQSTNASGQAAWTLTYSAETTRANLLVSETNPATHEFLSGSCKVTKADGTTTTTTLTSSAATQIAGVAPTDKVDCTYTNKPKTTGIARWAKADKSNLTNILAGSAWELTGPSGPNSVVREVEDCVGANVSACVGLLDQDFRAGYFEVKGLPNGTYSLTEVVVPDGYMLDPADAPGTKTITGSTPTTPVAIDWGVILNTPLPPPAGAVEWSKVADRATGPVLEGSEWKLVGPSTATTELAVTDCVATDASGCAAGPDVDHRAGFVRVQGLAPGSYQLIETKAPAGFKLDPTPRPVTVVGNQTDELGPIVNERQAGPALPLTGGLGTHLFLIGSLLLGGTGALLALRNRRRAARSI